MAVSRSRENRAICRIVYLVHSNCKETVHRGRVSIHGGRVALEPLANPGDLVVARRVEPPRVGGDDQDLHRRLLTGPDRAPTKGNLGSPGTELSAAILDLARDVLLQDNSYVDRVKRHYQQFRRKVDTRTGPARATRKPRKKRRKRR